MRVYRILVLAAILALGGPAAASAFSDAVCADCHSDTGGEPTEIGSELLVGSVHEGFSCLDCHTGVTSIPHAPHLPEPDCGTCHEDVKETYVQHGRGFVGVSQAVPSCQDCHGSHRILSHLDSKSLVHPSNLPSTCGNCHEDQEFL